MSDPQLTIPRRLLAAGCALGAAASVALPWFPLSCALYALAAAAFGAGAFLARAAHENFGIVWKAAIPAALIELAGALLTQYDLTLLTTLMTAIFFYFLVTYTVSALATVFHVKPGPDPRRPPRAAMQFEVAASLFALARLLSDMWPTLRTFTDTVAMAAMAIGFALVLQFVLKLKQPEE